MIEAELHDGTVLEFPDGTSKDVIQRAVKARSSGVKLPGGGLPPSPGPSKAPAPIGAAGAPQSGTAKPPVVDQTRQELPEVPSWSMNNSQAEMEARAADRAARTAAAKKGIPDKILKMALGVKQIFGGLDEEDKGVLRQMEAETQADPYGKVRDRSGMITEGALTAFPASRAAKLISSGAGKILPQALDKLVTPAVTAGAVSGGQGLALDVGEGNTYGEQMAGKVRAAGRDAALGAGLAGAGQILNKGTMPFKPTPEAVTLMEEGVNPTLQQGAEGKLGRFVGGLTSGAVDVSKRQNEEVIDALIKRISPNTDTAGMSMPEKLSALKYNLDDEMNVMMGGKKYSLSNAERSAFWSAARNTPGAQSQAVNNAMESLSRTGDAMNAKTSVPSMGYKKMEQYRGLLQDAVDEYKEKGVINQQTREALKRSRDTFDNLVRTRGMSADEVAQLTELDRRTQDYLRLENAAKTPGFHSNPKLSDVMRSYSQMGEGTDFAHAANRTQADLLEPAARVMGLTPNQDEARQLMSSLKRAGKFATTAGVLGSATAVNPMIGAALSPLYAASLAGQTAGGARMLMGQTGAQKALAEAIRKMAPYGAGAGQILGEDYAP